MVIVSLKKTRKIPLNNLSLTGHVISVKNNDIIEFESSLERDFVYLLEYNQNVLNYCEQPIQIEYFNNNRKYHYIPDFYVKYLDNTQDIIEIKYEKDLLEKSKDFEVKFKAANEFCSLNGFNFRIISEKDINPIEVFNYRFLSYYKYPFSEINSGDIELILNKLKIFKKMTVNLLLESLSRDQDRKAELLYVVWHLVSNHLINYQSNEKLNMNSLLWF